MSKSVAFYVISCYGSFTCNVLWIFTTLILAFTGMSVYMHYVFQVTTCIFVPSFEMNVCHSLCGPYLNQHESQL